MEIIMPFFVFVFSFQFDFRSSIIHDSVYTVAKLFLLEHLFPGGSLISFLQDLL